MFICFIEQSGDELQKDGAMMLCEALKVNTTLNTLFLNMTCEFFNDIFIAIIIIDV